MNPSGTNVTGESLDIVEGGSMRQTGGDVYGARTESMST